MFPNAVVHSVGDMQIRQRPRNVIKNLRPIIIDGQNIAVEHAKQQRKGVHFSSRGLEICVDYFKKRGHDEIVVFLPRFRHKSGQCDDQSILNKLENNGNLIFTPSREVKGRTIASYDDRYVVQYAASNGGVIVSNDNYSDIIHESPEMRQAIEERLLMFNFVGNVLMLPSDPLGKYGPSLDRFLSF